MKQLLIFYEFHCQGLHYFLNMLFCILRKKSMRKLRNIISKWYIFQVLLKRYIYENASDDPLF